MSSEDIIWRIAGGSGDGIDSTSRNFAKALMRSGLHVFTHRHYPSRIRGGHTYVEVRAGAEPVRSRGDGYNFLLALGDSFARNVKEGAYYGNEEVKPLSENLDELRDGGIILYDSGLIDIEDVPDFEDRVEEHNWHVYPMDLRSLAREHGREVMRNTAGVGATAAMLGIELDPIEQLMEEAMPTDIFETNLEILREAADIATEEFDFDHDLQIPQGEHEERQVLVSGSDAIAFGAIDEGCRFIAGYPMTPWTEVFTIMSQHLPKLNGIAEQVEDEIAAAALAIGASHAGVKAMSGSSGGGFALMSEPLGLAEMSETPVVLIEAMRAGPATGMPTKTEQGDLEHVLYTSQGDSTRIVFAPGTPEEAYEQTRRAFQIAYEYQVPAIVIIDQKLSGESVSVTESFFDRQPNPDLGMVPSEEELAELPHDDAGKLKRFQYDAEDGVNPRPIPGQKGGRYLVTGNEHNEFGHISEDPYNRVYQVDRRMGKLETIRQELDDAEGSHQTYYGPEDARYGIVTWGSQQGAAQDAVDVLRGRGHEVKSINVSDIHPYPVSDMREFLDSVDRALIVEMNASGQFRGLTQKELGAYGEKLSSLLKYDGDPFEPGEIVEGFEVEILDEGTGQTAANTRLEPAVGD